MHRKTSAVTALAIAASLAASATSASAQFGNFVIPPANAAVEGGANVSAPLQGGQATIQMLWAASNLVGVGPGNIAGIWFRLDGGAASYPMGAYSWASYTMSMRTTSGPLTTNLTANEAGATVVRSGPLSLASGAFTGGATPNAFSFFIPFSTPFFYGGGDLFLSIRHGDGAVAFQNASIDATVTAPTDLLSAIAFASGETATTGTLVGGSNGGGPFGFAVIAQIQVVPEPATVALVGIGLLGLVAVAKRRSRA